MKIKPSNGINEAEHMGIANRIAPNRATKTGPLTPPEVGSPAADRDSVYISARAETIAKLIERLKKLPDVRQERVDSLRARATSGDLYPTAEDIADAIIRQESPFPK